MAKKINSHVQLSKGIIKNFAKSEDDGNIFDRVNNFFTKNVT